MESKAHIHILRPGGEQQDPSTIGRCLHLMTISKALERIADHAKNIAEEAVYLYEARDIRHASAAGPSQE